MSSKNKGCFGSLLQLLGIGKIEKAQLPYKVKRAILSPAELSFFGVLISELNGKAYVLSKVRLVDIFNVSNQHENWSAYNQIVQKHIDYLICDPKTMKPLVGIELDDKSHDSASRKSRDEFLESVFRAGGLPLVRIKAKGSYNPKEIMEIIRNSMHTIQEDESQSNK
jgi:very-short-patch-repair endonuclease